ncbi:RidA family protein [Rathayibacter soli]|uniref:RidA family protein n=1 Tax=Rathayibacter soli TaxID=3144168 RepID=UPI0027E480FF|nr:RidA family protein [Glaciibacter superstes]
MTRRTQVSSTLPRPAGPYSHSASVGGIVYSAGQGGADAAGTLSTDAGTQFTQCFENVLAALAAGGASETDIVKVTVYLTDLDNFTAMNTAYAAAFSDPYPARTTVYVTLPVGMLIEVDATAITQEPQQ